MRLMDVSIAYKDGVIEAVGEPYKITKNARASYSIDVDSSLKGKPLLCRVTLQSAMGAIVKMEEGDGHKGVPH